MRSPVGLEVEGRIDRPDESAHAPHLLDVEVLQVLRRLARDGDLAADAGSVLADDLAALAVARHPHHRLLPRAWALRDSLTAYDAMYVALAEALDCPLVTCDARLARAHGHRARVEVIGRAKPRR